MGEWLAHSGLKRKIGGLNPDGWCPSYPAVEDDTWFLLEVVKEGRTGAMLATPTCSVPTGQGQHERQHRVL